jgi:RNA polymerase sigma factor (sigma-70 family)
MPRPATNAHCCPQQARLLEREVQAMLPKVIYAARRWAARKPTMDAESAVLVALAEAVRDFKPELGWQFNTYAWWKVRGQLTRDTRKAVLTSAVRAAELGSGKSDALPQEMSPVSLATPVRTSGRESARLGDLLPCPRDPFGEVDGWDAIRSMLAGVSEADRELLINRHVHGMKLGELAAEAGITREGIRNRLKRAERRVRESAGGVV